MNYGTGTEEVVESSYVSSYLDHSTAVVGAIQRVEYFTSSNKGTPGINVYFVATEPTEGLNNQNHPVQGFANHQFCKNQFWLTEGAMDVSKISSAKKFFAILAKNVKGDDGKNEWEAKAAAVTSNEEYAQAIEDYFGGMEFAGLLAGEKTSYEKDGQMKEFTASFLNYFGTFARPVANIDYLQAIIDGGKVKLFKDSTVQATSSTLPVAESTDNLLD